MLDNVENIENGKFWTSTQTQLFMIFVDRMKIPLTTRKNMTYLVVLVLLQFQSKWMVKEII